MKYLPEKITLKDIEASPIYLPFVRWVPTLDANNNTAQNLLSAINENATVINDSSKGKTYVMTLKCIRDEGATGHNICIEFKGIRKESEKSGGIFSVA